MSAHLCRWLNETVGRPDLVDSQSLEKDCSNGFLFGQVLHNSGYQDDFASFSTATTSEAKLQNFLRLEPTLRQLRVPFDANMAKEIMAEKPGAAGRLLYQLFITLNKGMQGGRPIADELPPPSKRAVDARHFRATLKGLTPRQSDLDLKNLRETYDERRKQQEAAAIKAAQAEQERALAYRKAQHEATLERTRQLKEQFDQRVKQIYGGGPSLQDTASRPRPNPMARAQLAELDQFEAHVLGGDGTLQDGHQAERTKQRGSNGSTTPPAAAEQKPKSQRRARSPKSRSTQRGPKSRSADASKGSSRAPATFSPTGQPDDEALPAQLQKRPDSAFDTSCDAEPYPDTGPDGTTVTDQGSVNDQAAQLARQRKQEDSAARDDRTLRRRRLLVQQMVKQSELDKKLSEKELIQAYSRQSKSERQVAAHFAALRREEEIMRQNRLLRQQQAAQQREAAFRRELDRQRAWAQQERAEVLTRTKVLASADKVKADRALSAEEQARLSVCRKAVDDIVTLAIMCGTRRILTGNAVEERLWAQWRQQFAADDMPTMDVSQQNAASGCVSLSQQLLDDRAFRAFVLGKGLWNDLPRPLNALPSKASEGDERAESAAAHTQDEAAALDAARAARTPAVVRSIVEHVVDVAQPLPRPWRVHPAVDSCPAMRAGLRLAVVGPPASGKSTLLSGSASTVPLHVISIVKLVEQAIEAHQRREGFGEDGCQIPFTAEALVPPEVQRHVAPLSNDGDGPTTPLQLILQKVLERAALEKQRQPKEEAAAHEAQGESGDGQQASSSEAEQTAADNKRTSIDEKEATQQSQRASAPATQEATADGGEVVGSANSQAQDDAAGTAMSEQAPALTDKPTTSLRAQLGNLALNAALKGQGVPDSILCALIARELLSLKEHDDGSGNTVAPNWALDGFPCTGRQAEMLEAALGGDTEQRRLQIAAKEKARCGQILELEDDERNRERLPATLTSSRQAGASSSLTAVVCLESSVSELVRRVLARKVNVESGSEITIDADQPSSKRGEDTLASAVDTLADSPDATSEATLFKRLETWRTQGQAVADFYSTHFANVHLLNVAHDKDAAQRHFDEQLTWLAAHEQRQADLLLDELDALDFAAGQQLDMLQRDVASRLQTVGESRTVSAVSRPCGLETVAEGTDERKLVPAPPSQKGSRPSTSSRKRAGTASAKSRNSKVRPSSSVSGEMPGTQDELEELYKQRLAQLEHAGDGDQAARETSQGGGDLVSVSTRDWSALPIKAEDAALAAALWAAMDADYARGAVPALRQLSAFDQAAGGYLYNLDVSFQRFLNRPDHKQEFVRAWQESFNDMPQDLRIDASGKAELFSRTEDAKDKLYDICDKRRDEAEDILAKLRSQHWLEQQSTVVVNAFLVLMQLEAMRHRHTCQCVSDFQAALCGTPPQPSQPMPTVAMLLDDSQRDGEAATEADGKDSSSDPTSESTRSSPKRESRPKGGEHSSSPASKDRERRKSKEPGVSQTEHHDVGQFVSAVEAAAQSLLSGLPETRSQPPSLVSQAKEERAQTLAAALEASSPSKGKGKGSAKPPALDPSAPPPGQPTPEEEAAFEAEIKVLAAKDAAAARCASALQEEDSRTSSRIRGLATLVVATLRDLHERAGRTFTQLAEAARQRHRAEIKAVDDMCRAAYSAIESEVPIMRQFVIKGTEFFIQQDTYMFRLPGKPLPPLPAEPPRRDAFSIEQLSGLLKHFRAAAPSGYMHLPQALQVISALSASSPTEPLFPPQLLSAMGPNKLTDMLKGLSAHTGYVDWRRLLVLFLDLPPMTPVDVAAMLDQARSLGVVSVHARLRPDVYQRDFKLWFETPAPRYDEETLAKPFHRPSAAKALLFDVFADDARVYSGRRLPLHQMLLYLCRQADIAQALQCASVIVGGEEAASLGLKFLLEHDQLHILAYHGLLVQGAERVRRDGILDGVCGSHDTPVMLAQLLNDTAAQQSDDDNSRTSPQGGASDAEALERERCLHQLRDWLRDSYSVLPWQRHALGNKASESGASTQSEEDSAEQSAAVVAVEGGTTGGVEAAGSESTKQGQSPTKASTSSRAASAAR